MHITQRPYSNHRIIGTLTQLRPPQENAHAIIRRPLQVRRGGRASTSDRSTRAALRISIVKSLKHGPSGPHPTRKKIPSVSPVHLNLAHLLSKVDTEPLETTCIHYLLTDPLPSCGKNPDSFRCPLFLQLPLAHPHPSADPERSQSPVWNLLCRSTVRLRIAS